MYLHPEDTASAVANDFESLHWATVRADVLEPILAEHTPRLPQRTVNQLHEFRDDIASLTGMSEHAETQTEKIELYVDHYEAITDVQSTFEDRWAEFADEWGEMLADRCEKSVDDWAYLYKRGWWRDAETLAELGPNGTDNDTLRVGFLHRLEHDREQAIADGELRFYFRNTPPNRHTEIGETNFRDEFLANFEGRRDEGESALPDRDRETLTGNMHNLIEATYQIRVDEHEEFFDAYSAALPRAFRDHALENEPLVTILDEIYAETLTKI